MTDEATPAAEESAPAADTSEDATQQPAASIVKNEAQSLADSADPNAAPQEPSSEATEPSDPPDNSTDPKWYLTETVPGDGEGPEWFKADKYKTLADQAKAYPDLEKRFGAFVGAPEDGTYKINPPEGVEITFEEDHPLFQEFNKWAAEKQFSQDGYDGLIDILARYELSMLPDMGQVKQQLGDNADSRINTMNQWAKSNLSEDEYKAYKEAQTQTNAASVFTAFEAMMKKTRQVNLPKTDDDVPGAVAGGLEEINKMQTALDKDGKRRYVTDSKYREEVEEKRRKYFENLEKQSRSAA